MPKKDNIVINKYDKKSYLSHLGNTFKNNKFINIDFSDLEIIRMAEEPPVYSFQLFQDYYSTNYADKGYLLVFTDFKDEEEPQIFFRYWGSGKLDAKSINELRNKVNGF